ncbi:MAG TPA: alpha/beta fold hydrolase [Baekduia sp.]|nr:alpha/beta fold hydrolase [Baekduia sp.]
MNAGGAPTLVLVHGFAGTSRSWDAVRDHLPVGLPVVAPDVRGRDLATCTRELLGAAGGRIVLAGYSMGGRLALHAALAAPERLAHLVLIATTAGIQDEVQRAARRAADEELAAWTEGATTEAFADRWMRVELFAGTPSAAAQRWRDDLLRQEPHDLAAALRGLGPGVLPPLWDRLPELDVPATVVVGERDARYRDLGARLTAALPRAQLHVVPGAGHGLPREAPRELARLLAAAAG